MQNLNERDLLGVYRYKKYLVERAGTLIPVVELIGKLINVPGCEKLRFVI